MTFAELISSMHIPNTAKIHLPQALSLETQKMLLNNQNSERVLLSAIEAINNGSIKTIDELVREQMR